MNGIVNLQVHELNSVKPILPMRDKQRLELRISIDESQIAQMIINLFDDWDDKSLERINSFLKSENFVLIHNENISKKCDCGYETEVGRIWCNCNKYK